jgi:hypothetical protein
MPTKRFLAAGDLLINPELLAYATVEDDGNGPRLRLVFAAGAGTSGRAEVRLAGEEAGAFLRWLRLGTQSLTSAGSFGPLGWPIEVSGSRPLGDSIGSPAGHLESLSGACPAL